MGFTDLPNMYQDQFLDATKPNAIDRACIEQNTNLCTTKWMTEETGRREVNQNDKGQRTIKINDNLNHSYPGQARLL